MKDGFTLIELLAVILILGIIALIAIPTINDIIEEAKKNSTVRSVENLVSTLEQECQLETMKGIDHTYNYFIKDGSIDKKIDIKGSLPSDASIIVTDECNVSIISSNNNYTYTKDFEEDKVNIYSEKSANTPISCFEYDTASNLGVDGDLGTNGIVITKYLCGNTVKDSKYDSVQDVYDYVYYNNDGDYINVIIPNQINGQNVIAIAPKAFSYESSSDKIGINSIKFNQQMIGIFDAAFWGNMLTKVEFNDKLLYIGASAFETNKISKFSISDNSSLMYIGEFAFYDNRITTIDIPDAVKTIKDAAFNRNYLKEEDATIYARNVNGINNTIVVSYGGAPRQNVIVPSQVTTIYGRAYYGNRITNITLPNALRTIYYDAFNNNYIKTLNIPYSTVNILENAFTGDSILNIIIDNARKNLTPISTNGHNETWGAINATVTYLR